MDRLLSSPRAQELKSWERPDKTLEQVREEYGGRDLSDEEMIRRHFAPVEDIAVTRAAGPVRRDYRFHDTLPKLVVQALEHPSARRLSLREENMSLDLRR
jgi:hypothetical protein